MEAELKALSGVLDSVGLSTIAGVLILTGPLAWR